MNRPPRLSSHLPAAIALATALACGGLADLADETLPSSSPEPVEGVDYALVQRARVVDHSGFGSPVEALSFLIPSGYRLESSVTWGDPTCFADLVAVRVSVHSGDGAVQIHQHPRQMWEHMDDPGVQQLVAAAGGVGMGGCPFRQGTDAARRLREVVVPTNFPGATIVKIEREADTERALTSQFQNMNPDPQVRVAVEVAGAELTLPDGSTGFAMTILMNQRSPSVSPFGAIATHTVQGTVVEITGAAPADRAEELERTLGLYLSSQRMNPAWDQAVQRVVAKISADNRAVMMERSRINFETSQAISDMNMRSWERRTESQDRGIEQFSQAIRGVETWREPDGGQIELPLGYEHAWRGADGSYVLSRDPLFDPNRALDQRWDPMQR